MRGVLGGDRLRCEARCEMDKPDDGERNGGERRNLCAIGDMDGHGVAPAFVRTLRLADIRAMSTASPGADGVAAVVPALAKFGTNWPNPVPNATLRMMAAM